MFQLPGLFGKAFWGNDASMDLKSSVIWNFSLTQIYKAGRQAIDCMPPGMAWRNRSRWQSDVIGLQPLAR